MQQTLSHHTHERHTAEEASKCELPPAFRVVDALGVNAALPRATGWAALRAISDRSLCLAFT